MAGATAPAIFLARLRLPALRFVVEPGGAGFTNSARLAPRHGRAHGRHCAGTHGVTVSLTVWKALPSAPTT
jgi:hypothetical protein